MALRRLAPVLGAASVVFPFAVIAGGFCMPIEDGSQPSYENLRPIAVIIVVGGLLSLTGLITGLAAILRIPPPRPRCRMLDGDDQQWLTALACLVSGQGEVAVEWIETKQRFTVAPKGDLPPDRNRINCSAPSVDGRRFHWFSHPRVVTTGG